MDRFVVPSQLRASAASNGWEDWLDGLPALVAELARRWALTLGPPFEPGGETAWVATARDVGGAEVVLKVGWPHAEARYEAEGLRVWAGDGAVRLLDAHRSETAVALLLERCVPGTPLSSLPEPEQDGVIAALLRRLWRPVPAEIPFPTLAQMCELWAVEFEAQAGTLDRGLAREGMSLFRSLPGTAEDQVLLTTDLHAGNVLAADREPWLAIDPKPHVGDPTYDLLQHFLNCERLHHEPEGLCRRMADLAGVDPERLRLWLFARCVQESPGRPRLADVARRLAPP